MIFLLWIWLTNLVGCRVDGAFAERSRERRPSFKIADLGSDVEMRLRPSPLIGGPRWLPLHVKLVLRDKNHQEYTWDFLPLNATEKEVLAKLATFQSVPGEIRSSTSTEQFRSHAKMSAETWIEAAGKFCEIYPQNLNLINNNCWTFAFGLALHLKTLSEEEVL